MGDQFIALAEERPQDSSGSTKPPSRFGGLDIVGLGELYAEPELKTRWLWKNRLGSGGVSRNRLIMTFMADAPVKGGAPVSRK